MAKAYPDVMHHLFARMLPTLRSTLCCLTLAWPGFSRADEALIDCHVHLWTHERPAGLTWIKKDDPLLTKDFLPPVHQTVAKASGVTGVVVVQAGQSLPDNQWNLDITARNPALYRGVVGNLSEVIGTEKFAPLLRDLSKDRRYLGYRLSGRYQTEMSEAFFRDLALTTELGKSVDFLIGAYTLKDVDAIAKRMPNLRIILDHFGNVKLDGKALPEEWIADYRAVAKQPNVYCKVSALYGRFTPQPAPRELAAYRQILDLSFECFGEDRLVYGSDWPVSESTADYAALLALTREYFATKGPGANAKLFHRNAVKFYAIPIVK